MTSTIFETERLLVRPLRPDDFPAFYDLQRNPNVLRYTGNPVQSEAENKARFDEIIGFYSKPGNRFWVWAVERKSDGIFLGTCALVNEGNELGYRLREEFWGNGYGQEVANGLVDHALDIMGLTTIFAEADKDNIASVKILGRTKLQFEKEYFHEKDQCLVWRFKFEK